MPSNSISGPLGTLRIEQDVIPVHYMHAADENWRFTDAAGHEHYWTGEPLLMIDGSHYPSLIYVVDEWCYRDHGLYGDASDPDGHPAAAHYECRLCGEHVSPGMTGPGTTMIPGMRTAYLDDEPVSGERAEEVMAAYIEAAQEARRDRDAGKVMDGFGIPRALRDQWNRT